MYMIQKIIFDRDSSMLLVPCLNPLVPEQCFISLQVSMLICCYSNYSHLGIYFGCYSNYSHTETRKHKFQIWYESIVRKLANVFMRRPLTFSSHPKHISIHIIYAYKNPRQHKNNISLKPFSKANLF